jgi:ABC-type amino acid transport system permease subunit
VAFRSIVVLKSDYQNIAKKHVKSKPPQTISVGFKDTVLIQTPVFEQQHNGQNVPVSLIWLHAVYRTISMKENRLEPYEEFVLAAIRNPATRMQTLQNLKPE